MDFGTLNHSFPYLGGCISGETTIEQDGEFLDEELVFYRIPKEMWTVPRERTVPASPFHVIDCDQNFFYVALCKSFEPAMQALGVEKIFDSQSVFPFFASEPALRGDKELKPASSGGFLEKAIHGIWTARRYGLDRFYRSIIFDERLRATIEWAILQRDINESSTEVFDRFLLRYLFLSLLGSGRSFAASNLVSRDRETWEKHFRQLGGDTLESSGSDAKMEMHRIAIFRGILEWAGGRTDPDQRRWDATYSVNHNVEIVLASNDVQLELVTINPSAMSEIKSLLSPQFNKKDILELQHIHLHVHLVFKHEVYAQISGTLPAFGCTFDHIADLPKEPWALLHDAGRKCSATAKHYFIGWATEKPWHRHGLERL